MVKSLSTESLRHHAKSEEKRSPSHSLHSRHHSVRHKARKVVANRSDCLRSSFRESPEYAHSSRPHKSSKSYGEKSRPRTDFMSKTTSASSEPAKTKNYKSSNQCEMESKKCSSLLGFDVTKDEQASELSSYLNDPEGLMRLAFEAITYNEIKDILPTSLKALELRQLFELCVEEVKTLSKSRIVAILEDKESMESYGPFNVDAVLSRASQREDMKLGKEDVSLKNEVCKRTSSNSESEQSLNYKDVKEADDDNAPEGYISLEDDYFDAFSSSSIAETGHNTT